MQHSLGELRAQSAAKLAAMATWGVTLSIFTNDIMVKAKPEKFKPPEFKMFEGKEDLVQHIYHFQQMMTLECLTDSLLCNVFPMSLTRRALLWFRQLRARSINSFDRLCEAFIANIYAIGSHKKIPQTYFLSSH